MDDPKFPDKKVIRAPSLKRGRNEERITDRVKLEKVLGVTVTSNAALTSDNNGTVAYPAGCTVVLLNTRTEQQNHIINASRKTVTALSYSACGRYIVSGECGHAPAVRIWDLQSDPQTGPHPGLAPQPLQIAEFAGHKYGINCVAFSPCGKFVVSVGTQHDMIVNVWDWRNNVKVASNKVSTKVKAVSFAENGSYFVTVGNRHVKFWYLEYGKARYKEAVPLMGRSAILGEQRNNYFCDVACGKGECADSTFAITRSGLLCEFNNRRLLDKWVELRTTSANCIAVGLEYIFVGCSDSIVRCFSPSTLRFVTTLPRTHYLGVDVAAGVSITHMASPPSDARYPDTMALAFDQTNHKLTCIYNDHSVYVWDCNNVKRVGKAMSALYHSACIWGVEMPAGPQFPPGSFLTCGSDDTIRVWSLDKLNQRTAKGIYQPNVYSNELIKVIYVDPSLSYIKDMDLSCSGTTEKQQQSNPSQTEGGSYDGRNGVRCIRVSPDGRHLASGDRAGNIRIYDTANMRELFKVEAHDSEVLCLEYSCPSDGARSLMASASRDRLLHVFDVDHGYQFLQTLDDHSSSITAVRFLTHPGSAVRMVSCGADKSLIFRTLNGSSSGSGKPQFNRENHATGKTTLYDMEVDSGGKHVLTACQDRQVRVYSAASGKHTKSFKGSMGDEGTLIKVALDRSGIYLATSCTDKSLSVYDYYSGECMASVCGHSELATGLRFTNDCRRLVSASGDGCVFVWRVPHDMVVTMHARLGQQALRHGRQLDREIFNDDASVVSVTPTDELFDSATTQDSNYRFSIGQLPQWAKKQLTEEPDQPPSLAKGVAVPKGRWAQRAEHGIKTLYSQPGPFPSLPFPAPDRRLDSDGSKDSSLDSGMDVKQYGESSKIITKQSLSTSHRRSAAAAAATNVDVVDTGFESAAHDGDVESDTDSRPLYYPAALDPPSSGGEFPVTNADADELRRSQRKRRPLPPSSLSLAAPPPAASSPVSPGSLESDEDDDDASTPSGQETDHRGGPTSLLSASVESLEQLGSRERYFQATFDSMSGPEGGTPGNKSSISAQFLTRSGGERNTEAINAVLQTRTDPEVTRKRLELNKRIAETKRKLESVGMSSPLKYSQSIHDLSRIPDRDKKWGHNSNSKQAAYLDVDAESPDSSLRRSCSLSDLSAQGPPVLPVPPKRRPAEGKRNAAAKEQPSRQQSRYTKGASLQIGRSRSSTVLNYSDSEPETHDKRVSRLMRPTISSYNKAAAQSRPAREKHSYSTSNLNSVGVDNGSTSDDENEAPRPAPRSRPVSFAAETPSGRSRSYRDSKAKRHTIHFDLSTVHSPPNLNGTLIGTYNETSAPLTPVPEVLRPNVSGSMSAQLCQEVIEQLTTSAEGVVEMYQRLSGNGSDAAPASAPPPSGEERRRDDLVRGLETSIIRTHKLLNDCIFRKLKQNSDGGPDVNQTDAVKKLHDLVAKGGPCSVVSMMEQYSDILLDLVQQKMHHVNIP